MTLLAHGIGSRTDLPIPFWLALYGAGIAVVASFAALGVLWPKPRLRGAEAGRPLPRAFVAVADSPVVRWGLRLVVLGLTFLVVAAGIAGPPLSEGNMAPYAFYVAFWVGLLPLSLLCGPIWRIVNPLRTLHALISRLAGTPPDRGLRELPAALGYWPAAVSLAAFVWLELVYPDRAEPSVVALWIIGYAVVHLVAAAVYGAAWFETSDGFEVYFSLMARLSPFGRRADGRLVVRNPLDGLAATVVRPGLVATLCVLIGSTAYDGITRTQWARDQSLESSPWLGTLVLALMMGVVAATYLEATRRNAAAFVHSVVPIALGYAVAHYFSLLMLEGGQTTLILAADPFGSGADWLGTARWAVNYTVVSTSTIALVQVGAIVIGHILGVVAAHDRAVRLFTGRDALRNQYPLLAVMVAYTVGGVALLLGT